MPDKPYPREVYRIQWYTQKVAEAAKMHTMDPRKRRRQKRLLRYKKALNERLF